MPESASRLLRENYAPAAKFLIAPMLDFLCAGRREFAGDLDRLLILLVVALRTAEDRKVESLRLQDVLSGAVDAYPSLLTNVRSVADSTGIPRETVRRKVGWLVAKGWLARSGDDLLLTPLASRELTPVRETMLAAAERLHGLVERARAGTL